MASDLLLSESLSDVTLKVRHDGYSWRLPAHSLLLVSKSSMFRDMLEERSESDKPFHLSFTGVMQPETGLAVLNYIYKEEYPSDVTADLLINAQRYDLPSLRDNLEERFMSDMTIVQACRMMEELQQRQPADEDCAMKSACLEMLETHALTVFGSDLVMLLGKPNLTLLLQSCNLNLPDDAYAFWGIWRWGRRYCSKNDRSLSDPSVASNIDDMVVLIRNFNVKDRKGIPTVASERFNRCKGPRRRYACPPDILKQSTSLRPCPTWEDIAPPKRCNEVEALCIQLSVEKDVMLVGMTLEVCPNDEGTHLNLDSVLQLLNEVDCTELRRQKVCWCRTDRRRTSVKGEPEFRMESELILNEPVFLTTGIIYSVYLRGYFRDYSFPWAATAKRRLRVGDTFVNLHGEGVNVIREIFLIPDMSVTWGRRGPIV